MSIMRIHKVTSLSGSKQEQFASYEHEVDTALPHDWLINFAAWCGVNFPSVNYDLIRRTTCIAYPVRGYVHPVTSSALVEAAFEKWDRSQGVTYNED